MNCRQQPAALKHSCFVYQVHSVTQGFIFQEIWEQNAFINNAPWRHIYRQRAHTHTHTFFNTLSDSVLRRSSDSSPSSFSPSEDREEKRSGGIEAGFVTAGGQQPTRGTNLLPCCQQKISPQSKSWPWIKTEQQNEMTSMEVFCSLTVCL